MKKTATKKLWRLVAIALMLAVALPSMAVSKRRAAKGEVRTEAAAIQLPSAPERVSAKPSAFAGLYTQGMPQVTGPMRPLRNGPARIKEYPVRQDSVPVIYGVVTFDPSYSHYGAIAVDNGKITDLREHECLEASWGGVYLNGLYYNTFAEIGNGGMVAALEAYLWDTNNNWRMIDYTYDGSIDMLAYAMAADPISDTVYGIFYNPQGNGAEFGTMDIQNLKRSGVIAPFNASKVLPMSMSADAAGNIWMIDSKGILYTIDKATGQLTKKAETGLACGYVTDGAIDLDSNIYYYFVMPSDEPADWNLYAINLGDFSVEKCYNFPIEIGGVFFKNEPKEQAPGAPTDLAASFDKGSLSGKVSFKAPSMLVDGSMKGGDVNYTVVFNDKIVATGTTVYGLDVEVDVTVPSIGRYDVRVFASNEVGMGPKTAPLAVWIGDGQPLQVSGLTATLNKATGKADLAWTAATAAELGGYIVPEEVSYTITRYTNGQNPVVVAKDYKDVTYTETLPIPENMEGYTYEVVANYKGQASVPATTQVLPLGVIMPPYENSMTSLFESQYFDMLNVDGDAYDIKFEPYHYAIGMKYDNMNPQAGANEWVFTQPVHMVKGKIYTVQLSVYNNSGSNGLEICTGTSPEPSAMTSTWYTENPLAGCNYAAKTISCTIRPDETGDFYIGMHVTGSNSMFRNFYMKNFSISEPYGAFAPNVVSNVEFVPPYDNTPTVEVKFTAPTKTVVDGVLTSITRIDVLRDGQLVKTFSNPTFGAKLSFVDEADEIGDYIYTFTGYNEYGTGYHYNVEGHVGIFIAKPPVDCQIEQYTDAWGSVKMTWEPVFEDINGYPVNPNWLQYVIGSGAGSSFSGIVQGVNPQDKEISLDLVRPNSGQALVALTVVPVTPYGGFLGVDNNGNSLNATTNQIFVGTPYSLPYIESFSNQSLHYSVVQSVTGWSIGVSVSTQAGVTDAQDGDKGYLYWRPNMGAGSHTTIETANIQIDDADDIALSFYYDAVPGHPSYDFYPYVICEGDTTIVAPVLNTGDAAENGWNHVRVSFDQFRGKVIRLGFYVYCVDYYGFFGLDNIQIRRFPANDLALQALNVPRDIKVGESGVISAQVRNEGYGASTPASVELYRDGKLMAAKDVKALEPYTDQMVQFDITAGNFWGEKPRFAAKVVWDADEFVTNNTLPDTAINVLQTVYPAVLDLTGVYTEADSSVVITWEEPDYAPKTIEAFEDCENLDPFNFSNLGVFTTYDAKEYEDGWHIWGKYPGNPNDGVQEPHAWFVMENDIHDYSKRYEWYATARSGNKSFASYDCKTEVTNDWLISPVLPGVAQTVTFYAATGEDYGSQEIEVYYSTTGTDIADFIQIGETIEVEEGEYDDDYDWQTFWNEISIDLPEGAKYFAIRNMSDNVWAVYIDDISYLSSTEVISLKGYNVYRNGDKLNEELITDRTWSEAHIAPASYTYHVEAIYDKGVAPLSEPYEVTVLDGIQSVDASAVAVKAGQGVIFISGAAGLDITVSNAQGLALHQAQGTGDDAVSVRPGVYVVKVADKAFKVAVR